MFLYILFVREGCLKEFLLSCTILLSDVRLGFVRIHHCNLLSDLPSLLAV